MKNKFKIGIGILACLILMTGCELKDFRRQDEEEDRPVIVKEAESDKLQKFRFSGTNDMTGLNPIKNTTSPDNSIHEIVFEGLVRNVTDNTGRAIIKPGVAEDWDISQDGKKYIFYIRDDARWSDGVPITSDDFVYTFRMMATPEVEAGNAWLFDDVIENFSGALYNEGLDQDNDRRPEEIGVRAVDGQTIEFNLERPNPSFLELLDKVRPIRQDRFEEWGEDYGRSLDKSLMNGQFLVDEWKKGQSVKMVKNVNYWNENKVKLQTVERFVINDKEEEIKKFIDDKIDCVDVTEAEDKAKIEDLDKSVKLINNPGVSPEFIISNAANEYLKNDKIRLALSLSIDREDYVENFRSKGDEVLNSLIPDAINMGDRTYADRVDYKNAIIDDLKEANPSPKKLLLDGLKEEGIDKKPEDIHLVYTVKDQGEKGMEEAEWVKSQMEEKLGIKISIEQISFEELLANISLGNYDLAKLGWDPDFNDPSSLLEIFNPVHGYFDRDKTGWEGESANKYREYLRMASNTPDPNERAYILLEAEKILLTEAVAIPLYAPSASLYIKGFVEGFNRSPHTSVDFTDIYTFGR